jgi:outer membrane protein insertion porin family
MKFTPWILPLLLTIGFSLGLNQPGRAQGPEPQAIIDEIAVNGLEFLPPAEWTRLAGTLQSLKEQPYAKETVAKDLERLSESGWFFRVTARPEPIPAKPTRVRLVFTVVENPQVKQIEIRNSTLFTSAELCKKIATQPGSVLNREQVTKDALEIKKRYQEKGYNLVEVTDINITKEGTLQFLMLEPKVKEIRVAGNKKTKEYVIKRELLFKNGDIYNERDVKRSLQSLERLAFFDEVTAMPKPADEPGTLDLELKVKERRTGVASIGLGHSQLQGLIGFVDVAETNLFGTGQRLSARAQFGGEDSYQLSYTHPWIDQKPTSFTVNLYDRSFARQLVSSATSFEYDENRQGINLTFGRPLTASKTIRGLLTLRNDNLEGTNVPTIPVSVDVPDPAALKSALEHPSTIRSLAFAVVRDTRDWLANQPTDGSYLSGTVEYAGFGGVPFTKLSAEGRRYRVIRAGKKAAGKPTPSAPWVLAHRLLLGTRLDAPSDFYQDQFLVGGTDSLRGYEENRFTGEHMILANNELRFPIMDALQGVLFVDAGDAWGGRLANQVSGATHELRVGYGFGVRLQTPIGPIRLDYGWGDAGNQFHFGIGPNF